MLLKDLKGLVVLVFFLVAEWKLKFIENNWAYYITVAILAVVALVGIFKIILRYKMNNVTPEFDMKKLSNPAVKFSLQTDLEVFSALSESFYMITETAGNTNDSYIDSLEILDVENAEAIQVLKDGLGVSWDINNKTEARNAIFTLIESAENQSALTIAELKSVDEIDAYKQYIVSHGLSLPAIENYKTTGFDLIRASWLVRSSFSVGYIDENEARALLNQVGAITRQQFNSWLDLAGSYLVMYLDWNGGLEGLVGSVMKNYMAKERVVGAKVLLESEQSPLKNYLF